MYKHAAQVSFIFKGFSVQEVIDVKFWIILDCRD